ncbi:MAG: hypothetical protein A2Y71_15940 [Bacteroidetes bacterium RBG_13_42_15]|nr:MAG: hypothetical protein A2Y71_15940 [Bacteroidetes bacterium RBG_13_42_15]
MNYLDRILGLDYGRRRLGISISDPLGLTAQPFTTWIVEQRSSLEERLRLFILQNNITRVVIGFPLTLKGEIGRMAREIQAFAEKLRELSGIDVILWDERLTSSQAKRFLHAGERKSRRKKENIDQIAAVLILQNYLDYLNRPASINSEKNI